jgi:hypothetical protein
MTYEEFIALPIEDIIKSEFFVSLETMRDPAKGVWEDSSWWVVTVRGVGSGGQYTFYGQPGPFSLFKFYQRFSHKPWTFKPNE